MGRRSFGASVSQGYESEPKSKVCNYQTLCLCVDAGVSHAGSTRPGPGRQQVVSIVLKHPHGCTEQFMQTGTRLVKIMLRRSFVSACAACAIASADEPPEVLIQGAIDAEVQPLLAALEGRRTTQISAWTFWEGRIGAKRVVVSRTEVGPINAVAATVLGIERYKPMLIINQGTAGAHNPSLRLWDIVIGDRNRRLRRPHVRAC
jgi:hypothetical protein